MKRKCGILFCAMASCIPAWDTPPHRTMTAAALETLPRRFREQLGPEAAALAETYCILPDRYVELKQFGFSRRGPGPRTLEEMQPYCVRPDGETVHSATWEREQDLASLVYLFERTIRSLSEKRAGDAARFLGTLAHFIEDSLSPPHAVGAGELGNLLSSSPGHGQLNIHSALERSVPEFTLDRRPPRAAAQHILPAAEAILSRCYAAADRNRRNLAAMVQAADANDGAALDAFRLNAGRTAAEILADSMQTIFEIASPQ